MKGLQRNAFRLKLVEIIEWWLKSEPSDKPCSHYGHQQQWTYLQWETWRGNCVLLLWGSLWNTKQTFIHKLNPTHSHHSKESSTLPCKWLTRLSRCGLATNWKPVQGSSPYPHVDLYDYISFSQTAGYKPRWPRQNLLYKMQAQGGIPQLQCCFDSTDW